MSPHRPGQQGVDVVRSRWVGAQRRRCHKCSCLGPVLAPVMGPICAEAGSDGLTEDHISCGGKREGVDSQKLCAVLIIPALKTAKAMELDWPGR